MAQYSISFETKNGHGYVRFDPDTQGYYIGSGNTKAGNCIFTLDQAQAFNKNVLAGRGELEVTNPAKRHVVTSREEFLNEHRRIHKLSPKDPTFDTHTQLFDAITAGDDNLVTTLLSEIHDPVIIGALFTHSIDVNNPDLARVIFLLCDGRCCVSDISLLGVIIRRRHDAGLTVLLDAGADPNRPYSGITPLHDAIDLEYDLGITELLNRGADAVTCAAEFLGTCLHRHDYRTCQLLLQYKADVNARHTQQMTPLMYTLQIQSTIGAKFLLDAKADPDLVEEDHNTALYVMATRRDVGLTELLLTHKAGANVICSDGRTALHAAVRTDDPTVVSLLLNAKADPTIADNEGVTPTMLARSRNCAPIMRLMRPRRLCEVCKSEGQTYPCSRCKHVSYCSRVCQKADWVNHKFHCCVAEIIPPPTSPNNTLKQDRDNEASERRRNRSCVLVTAIEDYINRRIDAHQLRSLVGQGYELNGDDRDKYQAVLDGIQVTPKQKHRNKVVSQPVQPTSKPAKKKVPRKTRPTKPTKSHSVIPNAVNVPTIPCLPPLPPMTASERLDWHGQASRVIPPECETRSSELFSNPDSQTDVKTDAIIEPSEMKSHCLTIEPTYSLLMESPTFGSLMLDYTHIFTGERYNNGIHGFHHDYQHKTLGTHNINTSTFHNGCYTQEWITPTGTTNLILFPAIWHPNELLMRLKLALTGTAYTVYTDPDTCIAGELPKLPGDRDNIALFPIYFKAVIKRDVPGVIRTLYPLTSEQYTATLQQSQD